MKRIILSALLAISPAFLFAQKLEKVITVTEVERIEKMLASDQLRGRRAFTPDIDSAAELIATEFQSIGLQTWDGSTSFLQKFVMTRPKLISVTATLDGVVIDPKNIIVLTCQPDLAIIPSSGYDTATIKAGGNLTREAAALAQSKRNVLVLVDTSYTSVFNRLAPGRRAIFKNDRNIIYILGTSFPKDYKIEAKHEFTEQGLSNVVGIIPGKDKDLKKEYVIFSGHYDHLGVGKPVNGDSIFNGANDDAAGVTAVIMLAKYYKELKDNDRTLVFAAFTAEEVGGFGSQYFSKQFEPAKVVAMFNIEMIGTDSKWGKNSAYITGYEKTNMGAILQKNLEGTGFTFYPDPYPSQNLFTRSDNATLARLGVPAHTISTAKMDGEPNYHKVSDQVETLDLDNMTMIIRSIALSAREIIKGKETPTRVKVEELR
jgi:hypothetical protein